MRKILKKVVAFTLAETLIVMGIIGIISALTLPNLNSSTGEKEKVAKVKKLYQNLNDALGRAEAVYGPLDEWFIGSDTPTATKKFGERMADFMKTSKNCGVSTGQGCFSSKDYCPLATNTCAKSVDTQSSDPFYKVITADGTSVAFRVSNINCTQSSGQQSNICAYAYIDIDGPIKGQNKFGIDLFQFFVDSEMGVVPHGAEINTASTQESLISALRGGSQAGWVIKNENLDYLKIDANGKCSNSTKVLNWSTNTTCK